MVARGIPCKSRESLGVCVGVDKLFGFHGPATTTPQIRTQESPTIYGAAALFSQSFVADGDYHEVEILDAR